MILVEKKIIFIHIPKNAGTSMEHLLAEHPSWGQQFWEWVVTNKYSYVNSTLMNGYFKYAIIRRFIIIFYSILSLFQPKYKFFVWHNKINHTPMHMQRKNGIDSSWTSFAIVRNPYTHMISVYNHFKPKITFEEMVGEMMDNDARH